MPNATKVYLFSFFQMALVIIPVAIPYYSSLGLSMADIYKLQAIFGLAVMLSELPTGYVADLWGRKKTLVAGSLFVGIGFTYLIYARTFPELVLMEVITALGFSLISGADLSMLYEGVAFAETSTRKKVLSTKLFAELSGEASAALLGGLLVIQSFHAVLVANAIIFWVPFLIALTFVEIPYKRLSAHTHRDNFMKIIRHIFKNNDNILRLGFLNNIVWGLSTIIAVWLLQRYWQLNHVGLFYFGILWAVLNVTAGVIGKAAHGLERRFGPLPLLITIGAAPVLAYGGMAAVGGFLGILFGLLFYVCRGLNYVLLRDIVNWRTPSEFRTTVNSAQSFFFRFGFALFGPLVGTSIDRFGMDPTLVILAVIFAAMFVFTMLPLVITIKKTSIDYVPE